MPRDFSLESEGQTLHGLAPLSREVHKSPNPNPDFPEDVPLQQSPGPIEMDDPESPQDRLRKDMLDEDRRNELHPFVQTLSSSHVDSCVVVENAAFPENERCTREKVSAIFMVITVFRITIMAPLLSRLAYVLMNFLLFRRLSPQPRDTVPRLILSSPPAILVLSSRTQLPSSIARATLRLPRRYMCPVPSIDAQLLSP